MRTVQIGDTSGRSDSCTARRCSGWDLQKVVWLGVTLAFRERVLGCHGGSCAAQSSLALSVSCRNFPLLPGKSKYVGNVLVNISVWVAGGWFAKDAVVLRLVGNALLDMASRRDVTLRRWLVAKDGFDAADSATSQALYEVLPLSAQLSGSFE
jgi:hypothetical protein